MHYALAVRWFTRPDLKQGRKRSSLPVAERDLPRAVEFLPLGDLFPGANKALTEKAFCMFSHKFTTAKASSLLAA